MRSPNSFRRQSRPVQNPSVIRNNLILDSKDPINRNLDAYWPLNTSSRVVTSGSAQRQFLDLGPRHIAANTTGGAESMALGRFKEAWNGSGTGYIATGYTPPTTNVSYSFWAQSGNSGANNRPMGNSDFSTGTQGIGIIWGFPASNQLYVLIRSANSGAKDITVTPPTSPTTPANWHHVVVTIDSVAGAICYWDGVSAGTNAASTSFLSSLAWNIGRDANGGTSFVGKIQEVRMWSRVITPGEVQRIYRDTSGTLGMISPPAPRGSGVATVRVDVTGVRGTGWAGNVSVSAETFVQAVGVRGNSFVHDSTTTFALPALGGVRGIGFSGNLLTRITPDESTVTVNGVRGNSFVNTSNITVGAELSPVRGTGFVNSVNPVVSQTGFGIGNIICETLPYDSSDVDVYLRVSHTGGLNWNDPMPKTLGAIGEHDVTLQWWKLGQARVMDIELGWSSPVQLELVSLSLESEESSS